MEVVVFVWGTVVHVVVDVLYVVAVRNIFDGALNFDLLATGLSRFSGRSMKPSLIGWISMILFLGIESNVFNDRSWILLDNVGSKDVSADIARIPL